MDWDSYFMGIAKATALKSKDQSSKVGAVIVAPDKSVVSLGFNGFIAGCDESYMTQERPMKYHQVIHAEMNALIFANTRRLTNHVAYVTHGPCDNCLKHLLQSGIRKIVYDCPGIMRDRGTEDQKKAIKSIIQATNAEVKNISGTPYLEELWSQSPSSET